MPANAALPRRALLSGLTAGLAVGSGCSSDGETPGDSPTRTDTGNEPSSPTGTATPTGTLTLDPVPVEEADGPLTVYPTNLAGWLRTATTGTTVRDYADTPSYTATTDYSPTPPLPALQRVRIDDRLGDASGTYELSASGGARYQLLAGAEATSPPDGAEVVPVSSLPTARRELALSAIGVVDGDQRVHPETELGSWARTRFFGGYYSYDGTTYRGTEVQQTDAAFFSMAVWYVLSAAPAEEAATTLRFAAVPAAVRRAIGRLRDESRVPGRVSGSLRGETAAAVQAFAAEQELLLTHNAVFRLRFED